MYFYSRLSWWLTNYQWTSGFGVFFFYALCNSIVTIKWGFSAKLLFTLIAECLWAGLFRLKSWSSKIASVGWVPNCVWNRKVVFLYQSLLVLRRSVFVGRAAANRVWTFGIRGTGGRGSIWIRCGVSQSVCLTNNNRSCGSAISEAATRSNTHTASSSFWTGWIPHHHWSNQSHLVTVCSSSF